MSQRREKRFRQLERRVSALEVQIKFNREEKMMKDIETAVHQRCMDADWAPAATNTTTARRSLLQKIKNAWRSLQS